MITRQFLTDDQLDAAINHLPTPDAESVAVLDQADAAARDMTGISYAGILAAAAQGEQAFLGVLSEEPAERLRVLRPRMRMVLAAFSGGVAHLCHHTRQIRPLMLICDPPALVCIERACLARVPRHIQTVGHNWDHQCDSCGQATEIVFQHTTALGALGISGHICEACKTALTQAGTRVTSQTRAAARRGPCPCGSGRRFKACHGRAA